MLRSWRSISFEWHNFSWILMHTFLLIPVWPHFVAVFLNSCYPASFAPFLTQCAQLCCWVRYTGTSFSSNKTIIVNQISIPISPDTVIGNAFYQHFEFSLPDWTLCTEPFSVYATSLLHSLLNVCMSSGGCSSWLSPCWTSVSDCHTTSLIQ